MKAKLCWVRWWSMQFVVLMYKPERERAFLIICERHSIHLAKGNQGRSWRLLKRFDSQNEFDPDEGWRNRDREGVVGANLSWQPCDFHSDWLFKASLEAWRIFTSFPAKKSTSPLYNNSWDKCAESTLGDGGGPWWLTSGWSAWDGSNIAPKTLPLVKLPPVKSTVRFSVKLEVTHPVNWCSCCYLLPLDKNCASRALSGLHQIKVAGPAREAFCSEL